MVFPPLIPQILPNSPPVHTHTPSSSFSENQQASKSNNK